RAQEARSTPSRMTSFMIAHFAELDAHNRLSPAHGGAPTGGELSYCRRIHTLKGECRWIADRG
ncbi:hypothetical protein NKH34_25395, partial [Mesorhizobium sp. M1148]|uniref:hypothetical protein n=1 Tax=Mesorhizobium sp. M1148 TaxID=2957062 RepID=UPI0033387629